MYRKITYFLLIISNSVCYSQKISGVLNQYAPVLSVSAFNSSDVDSITLAPADITKFQQGDTVMIYQTKALGFTLLANQLTLSNAGHAGKFELLKIKKINGNTIVLNRELSKEGVTTYNSNGSVQVIKVSSYLNAEIQTGDTVKALPWDGSRGGVVALIINNRLTLEGCIDASGKGFLGAQPTTSAYNKPQICISTDSAKYGRRYNDVTASIDYSGIKGEGMLDMPDTIRRGLGNFINGGGGGVGYLSGGAGGANMGDGGIGGNEASTCNNIDYLLYSEGGKKHISVIPDMEAKRKIFIGGGGGSAVSLTSEPSFITSRGTNGGGIIIIISDEITGKGKILSNGESLSNISGSGGGGGGGGTILLDITRYLNTDSLKLYANGADGVNSTGCPPGSGVGGGGGGGGGGGLLWFNKSSIPPKIGGYVAGGMNGRNLNTCVNNSAHSGYPGDIYYNLIIPLRGLNFNSLPDSQVICIGDVPDTIKGSTPKGSVASPSYSWQSSINLTVWNNLAGTAKDYGTSAALVQTTYFRRIVTISGFTDTSNIHRVQVYAAVGGNALTINPVKVCEHDGKTITVQTTTAITGGVPAASLQFVWEKKTIGNWRPMTQNTENISIPNPDSAIQYRRTVIRTMAFGKCSNLSAPVTLTMMPQIKGNTIGFGLNNSLKDTTVCYGNPTGIVRGKKPTGGDGANYAYLWEKSYEGSNWASVAGTLQHYTLDTLHSLIYMRRISQSDVCTGYSDTAQIIVLDTLSNTAFFFGLLCFGDTLIQTPQPQGGDGTYSYKWEKSLNGIIWPDSLDNKKDLQINITDTIYLRRNVYSGPSRCCKTVSASHPVFLYPYSKILSVSALDSQLCRQDTQHVSIIFKGIKPWFVKHTGGSADSLSADTITFSYPSASNYFRLISVKDANSCPADTTGMSTRYFVLKERPAPLIEADTAVCGLSAPVSVGNQTGTGFWSSFGPLTALVAGGSVTASDYGIVRLVYTETNGLCSESDTLKMTFDELPVSEILTPDSTLYYRYEYPLNAVSPSAGTGNWSVLQGAGTIDQPGNAQAVIFNMSVGSNKILWRVTNGSCSAADSVVLLVNDLFIPNGFSPNGDGTNDRFDILGIENASSAELTIFNNWGGVVFQSGSYHTESKWDGTNKGNPLPEDSYYYILNLKGKVYKGIVVIKR